MDFGALLLTLVTFAPLLGAAALLLVKPEQKNALRWVALITALVTFGISLGLLAIFNPADAIRIDLPWLSVAGWNVHYHLALDGLSILLVLLTTLLTPLAILSTWTSVEDRVRQFMAFFLMLETGMLGVFLAQDLFLFYIFWEFTLVPMYFLIGIWGGERRIYAAVKFFLYTMAGSVLMLVALLWLGTQYNTFSLPELIAQRANIPPQAQTWLFLAFALAFAIKVPMWPLHTWLPDAHVEAPTAGSVILAGVLLKMGTYGFLRFNLTLFPQASWEFSPWMALLAIIGILYGALVSYAQTDAKKLVAYSSVSHLGFVMLGLFALNQQGIQGALLQMINHGLSTGALFLMVGMLYERRHTRALDAFGGLWKVIPVFGTLLLIVSLSSVGLPGLNGFIGEFTILLGAAGSDALGNAWNQIVTALGVSFIPMRSAGGLWFAGFAALGVIFAAAYLLQMYQKICLGALKAENQNLKDLSWREIITLLPLLVLIFWIGLYPKPFIDLIAPAINQMLGY